MQWRHWLAFWHRLIYEIRRYGAAATKRLWGLDNVGFRGVLLTHNLPLVLGTILPLQLLGILLPTI
jgi:hypothetical protein